MHMFGIFVLMFASCISCRGTSTSSKLAPFRECYGRLHELRSLIPSAVILSLTATATRETKQAILDVLGMKDPYKIEESPEKPNVSYVVEYMQRDKSLCHQFEWLVEEINKNGLSTERTIIYCQTIQQCSHIYSTLKSMIGDTIYAGKVGDKRNVLLEMLHSCSPPSNKEAVLKSFQDPKGVIRILVATIAFGMGVDCRAVHRTIHFGPSKNLEAFVQESGRAGRDGKPSVSYLLYHGLLLTHVEKDIKNFIHTKDCRRKFLLEEFNDTSAHTTVVDHLCCDNCSKNCGCGSANCNLLKYPSKKDDKQPIISRERDVSDSQKQQLEEKLKRYHKSLVAELVRKHANGIIKSQISLPMFIGFSELQISQVLEHCGHLFTLQDVYSFIEIWDIKHAVNILTLIDQVFGDILSPTVENSTECCEDADIEDELDLALHDWNDVIGDDDFMDLIFDNLDSSQMPSELQEESGTSSHLIDNDIPNAVLEILENFSFEDA